MLGSREEFSKHLGLLEDLEHWFPTSGRDPNQVVEGPQKGCEGPTHTLACVAQEWQVGGAGPLRTKGGNGGSPSPAPAPGPLLPPHSTPSSPRGAGSGGPFGRQFRVASKKIILGTTGLEAPIATCHEKFDLDKGKAKQACSSFPQVFAVLRQRWMKQQ